MNRGRAASDRQHQVFSSANEAVATGPGRGGGDVSGWGGMEEMGNGGWELSICGGLAYVLVTPVPPVVVPHGMLACLGGEWMNHTFASYAPTSVAHANAARYFIFWRQTMSDVFHAALLVLVAEVVFAPPTLPWITDNQPRAYC